jgi:heme-degrading monooxygenase HmoA
MFVAVISFPPIKAGKDAEFKEWFAWSNQEFSHFNGFVRRRLLKPLEGGNYAAIVELESREAFQAMEGSAAHDQAHERVVSLFEGKPSPHYYEVVVG